MGCAIRAIPLGPTFGPLKTAPANSLVPPTALCKPSTIGDPHSPPPICPSSCYALPHTEVPSSRCFPPSESCQRCCCECCRYLSIDGKYFTCFTFQYLLTKMYQCTLPTAGRKGVFCMSTHEINNVIQLWNE